MYAFIIGSIEYIGEGLLILNNNGIGYNIFISNNTASKLNRNNEEVKIYTHTYVKEDAFQLYGFLHIDEKKMFEKLININGVGCKMAMQILSGIDSATLAVAIAGNDVSCLSKIKGVGKKTAERIILELKEKVDIGDMAYIGTDNATDIGDAQVKDAVSALVSLGINKADAYKAVMKAREKTSDTNGMITLALRGMDR